jgi:hypothetical protein
MMATAWVGVVALAEPIGVYAVLAVRFIPYVTRLADAKMIPGVNAAGDDTPVPLAESMYANPQ